MMPTSVGIIGKPLPCKKDLMPVGNGFWKSLNHSHLGGNKTSRNAWIWRSLGQPCCQRPPVGGALWEQLSCGRCLCFLSRPHLVVVHLVLTAERSQGHSGHPLLLWTSCYLKIWANMANRLFHWLPPTFTGILIMNCSEFSNAPEHTIQFHTLMLKGKMRVSTDHKRNPCVESPG